MAKGWRKNPDYEPAVVQLRRRAERLGLKLTVIPGCGWTYFELRGKSGWVDKFTTIPALTREIEKWEGTT